MPRMQGRAVSAEILRAAGLPGKRFSRARNGANCTRCRLNAPDKSPGFVQECGFLRQFSSGMAFMTFYTRRCPGRQVQSRGPRIGVCQLPRVSAQSCAMPGPSPPGLPMIGANVSTKPQLLVLSLAVTLALAACKRDAATPTAAADTARPMPHRSVSPSTRASCRRSTASPRPTSTPAKNACTDFDGYVNGKWLAANPIPGDRTTLGRVRDARRALQRRAAASSPNRPRPKTDATGVEKIVGDFWATGMDEAKINAQGIEPLEGAPGRDRRAGRQRRRSPSTCAPAPPRARASCSASAPKPDFKDSTMNIAYADAGRPRPAGQELLLRRRQEGQAATPTRRTSPRCSSCPASPPPMPRSRPRT